MLDLHPAYLSSREVERNAETGLAQERARLLVDLPRLFEVEIAVVREPTRVGVASESPAHPGAIDKPDPQVSVRTFREEVVPRARRWCAAERRAQQPGLLLRREQPAKDPPPVALGATRVEPAQDAAAGRRCCHKDNQSRPRHREPVPLSTASGPQ